MLWGDQMLGFVQRLLAGRSIHVVAVPIVLGLAGTVRADVVILNNGRAYAGLIEEQTSRSVQLFDGNLRRVVATAEIKEISRERMDTSWVIVGDLMVRQRDWETAASAYRKALDATDQPDVLLRRLQRLRAFRYRLPGGEEAESLVEAGNYAEAARTLFGVIQGAQTVAQRHYWTDQLGRAYAGLASQEASSPTAHVDPYLVYALAIAPHCGRAHALLGERLEALGNDEAARQEFLLALDLDPIEARARSHLAVLGEPWTYDSNENDRSGLREAIERRSPLVVESEAPLTTAALARLMQRQLGRPGVHAGRLLLAAYLLDPTAALAYEGHLPYPTYGREIALILKESSQATGTTPHDKTFIGTAIKVRIDPRFVRAIAQVRSACQPTYVSPDGARGIVPMTRGQWEAAAHAAGVDWRFEPDALDAEKNIEMACRYLDWLRRVVLKPYAGGRLDRLERVDEDF